MGGHTNWPLFIGWSNFSDQPIADGATPNGIFLLAGAIFFDQPIADGATPNDIFLSAVKIFPLTLCPE